MTYFEIYRVTNGVPQPRLRVAQTRVQAEIAAKRQAAIHDLPIVECEILPASPEDAIYVCEIKPEAA
jgi:hypothetical protein